MIIARADKASERKIKIKGRERERQNATARFGSRQAPESFVLLASSGDRKVSMFRLSHSRGMPSDCHKESLMHQALLVRRSRLFALVCADGKPLQPPKTTTLRGPPPLCAAMEVHTCLLAYRGSSWWPVRYHCSHTVKTTGRGRSAPLAAACVCVYTGLQALSAVRARPLGRNTCFP